MVAPYTYQRVDGEPEDDGDSETTKVFSIRRPLQPWYRRPSVLWLLPTFLLLNLAMGATSMPRMNVLISLICRNRLLNDPSSLQDTMSGGSMQNERRHGGFTGTHSADMAMNGSTTDLAASGIVIGDYNPQCASSEIESAASMLQLWGNLIAGILGAISTPFWGKISDRFGRIKPLAAACSVLLVSEIFMVLLSKYPDALPFNWVYLTFVLEGLSGSFILIMALASSYAADVTKMEDRNVALGWFHGSMFFGMAAGPAAGGYLGMIGGKSNPLLIFYVGLGMRAVAILLLLIVPESLENSNPDHRPLTTQLRSYLHQSSQGSWQQKLRRVNPLRLLQILTPANTKITRPTQRNLLALATSNTILFGAVMGGMYVMMLYSEFRFGWGNKESGVFLSTVNIFRTLATVVVLPLTIKISRRYFGAKSNYGDHGGHGGGHGHGSTAPTDDSADCCSPESAETGVIEPLDLFLLRASILSDAIGYIGYALAPTGFLFTLSGAIASLGAIGLATSEASMTKLLPTSQTGELLGALGFLQAMARIVTPTVASLVYSWTTKSFPQLVFWGIAVMFVVAGAITYLVKVGDEQKEKRGAEEGEDSVPLREGIGKRWEDD